MRYQDGSILQQDIPLTPKQQALWLLANGCTWIGGAFIGLGLAVLSKARKPANSRHHSKVSGRVLLPSNGQRKTMQEIKITCPGCRRNVNELFPIGNTKRCEDCCVIAEAKGIQFDKASLN